MVLTVSLAGTVESKLLEFYITIWNLDPIIHLRAIGVAKLITTAHPMATITSAARTVTTRSTNTHCR